ncbi:hypothetical protein Tco_1370382 [Tanacetum coccineum]
MAQMDMLERFENLFADYDALAKTHSECSEAVRKLVDARLDLEHNGKLYTDAMSRYKTVKDEHAGCVERITKKRTKNKAKTTKPDSEWKRL